jgi:hypothetical protein
MDYIFFSSIIGVALLAIAISYDIVCQWKIKLDERMKNLPARLIDQAPGLPSLYERLHFGLPVWHVAAHERDCQVSNSLRYQKGMGHTDGEGIECGWSHINGQSSSTKEMGPGNPHNTLDNHFGYHNWQQDIGLGTYTHSRLMINFTNFRNCTGDSLMRKLCIAIDERNSQISCFEEIKNSIKKATVKGFKEQVEAWEKDQTKPNPYLTPKKSTSYTLVTLILTN